jgi:hypothetical protein
MTLKEQLAKFLRDGHGFVASGDLQRMDWYDNRGRLVTPANISRRLRELAADGVGRDNDTTYDRCGVITFEGATF